MSYGLDRSFDEMLADGADFFSLFGDFAESFEDQPMFGLSDDDLAELVE